jgi:hypothetical protein
MHGPEAFMLRVMIVFSRLQVFVHGMKLLWWYSCWPDGQHSSVVFVHDLVVFVHGLVICVHDLVVLCTVWRFLCML